MRRINTVKENFNWINLKLRKNFLFEEFDNECEILLQDSLPELQQYFMQFGYDFQFVDYNLNLDYNPFIDPHLFATINKELEDCVQYSNAAVCLVIRKNKTFT